jgi:hypothetical protein
MFLGLLNPDPVSLVRGRDLEGHLRKEQDPDPSARDTDPRIQIRTKMSRIRNTDIMNYFDILRTICVFRSAANSPGLHSDENQFMVGASCSLKYILLFSV